MLDTAEQIQQKRSESASLIMELVRMGESSITFTDREKQQVFLGKNQVRVREIGIKLNELGGMELMDFASRHISVRDACGGRSHRPELNIVWENIGEWNV